MYIPSSDGMIFFKIITNSDLCSFSLSVHFFYFLIRCESFSQIEGLRKFIDHAVTVIQDPSSCKDKNPHWSLIMRESRFLFQGGGFEFAGGGGGGGGSEE